MSNVPHGRKMQWSSRAESNNHTGTVGGHVRKTDTNTGPVGATLDHSTTVDPGIDLSRSQRGSTAATARVGTASTTVGGEQFNRGGVEFVGDIELNKLNKS